METHHINCIIKGDDSGMSSKKKAIRQRILESAQILILGKQGRILIEGRYLQIPFYTSEEMKITGQIDQIRYL